MPLERCSLGLRVLKRVRFTYVGIQLSHQPAPIGLAPARCQCSIEPEVQISPGSRHYEVLAGPSGGEGGIRTLGLSFYFNNLKRCRVQIVSNSNAFLSRSAPILGRFRRSVPNIPDVSREGHPCDTASPTGGSSPPSPRRGRWLSVATLSDGLPLTVYDGLPDTRCLILADQG